MLGSRWRSPPMDARNFRGNISALSASWVRTGYLIEKRPMEGTVGITHETLPLCHESVAKAFRNAGEKKVGSRGIESAHCIIRRQFRGAVS
ncbi:hypothetical protein EVAR_28655_1 [Eumeta japonica]|uniref:Uncharacterized protein n=1 Tax=Eumeta variegata TaxID=151549 RepID=A0A4C2A7K3_EUMVA|nr:hypothetical protein EVAR_28655_1 [Eumeta japonica]